MICLALNPTSFSERYRSINRYPAVPYLSLFYIMTKRSQFDTRKVEADAKRSRSLAPKTSDDEMEIEARPVNQAQSTATTSGRVDSNRILREMIAGGNYSQDEIVQFCIDSGIPLSRMFELDLIRLGRPGQNQEDTK